MPMSWCTNLNGEEPNYLVIKLVGSKFVIN